MTVVEGWFSGQQLDHAPYPGEMSPDLLNELKLNIALNSKVNPHNSGVEVPSVHRFISRSQNDFTNPLLIIIPSTDILLMCNHA